MHQRLTQAELLLPLDARYQFVQMRLLGLRRNFATLVNALLGVQVQSQRCQGMAGGVIEQQRSLELVTDVALVGELRLVRLAVMTGKITLAPVVGQQQETAIGGSRLPSQGQQRSAEHLESGILVIEEAPGLLVIGQGLDAGCIGWTYQGMFFNQGLIPPKQAGGEVTR